jgi:hypothetical protein
MLRMLYRWPGSCWGSKLLLLLQLLLLLLAALLRCLLHGLLCLLLGGRLPGGYVITFILLTFLIACRQAITGQHHRSAINPY